MGDVELTITDRKYLQLLNYGRILASLTVDIIDPHTKELPHGKPYVEGTELMLHVINEHPTICANILCTVLELAVAATCNQDVTDYDTQRELGN